MLYAIAMGQIINSQQQLELSVNQLLDICRSVITESLAADAVYTRVST